ncbi:MAG: response regulator [Bacteroidia bacterium]
MALLKILLIDDDKDDQFFFFKAIKEIDPAIICEAADDGRKGLNRLESGFTPDIIFLDLNMPQMNGFDFLRAVKQSGELKQIPVVIFSTSNNPQDIKKAEDLGAAAFLTKPNNMAKLAEELSGALYTDFSSAPFTDYSR